MSQVRSLCQAYAEFAEGVSNTIRALAEPDYSDVSNVASIRLEELLRVADDIHNVVRRLISSPVIKNEDVTEALTTLEFIEKRSIAEGEIFKWGPWPPRLARYAGDMLRETLAESSKDPTEEGGSRFLRHPHFFLGLLRWKRDAQGILSPHIEEWEARPKSPLDGLSAEDLQLARYRRDITEQEWDDAVNVQDVARRLEELFTMDREAEAIPLISEMRGASERSNLRSWLARSDGYEAWVLIATREGLEKGHYDRCWDLLVRALAHAVLERDLASCRAPVQGLCILYRDIGLARAGNGELSFSGQELGEKLAFSSEIADLNERCGEEEFLENLQRGREQIEAWIEVQGL
jgi:hypothetical protein